jgi:hydroxyethylthiazole kinase-like uncharacterized protein yjeF
MSPPPASSRPFAFPARARDAHKGSVGNVLVVAGSRGMSGAAWLTSRACLRGGAGLVTLACPAGIHDALEHKTTCVMTRPLPETSEGSLSKEALEPLLSLTSGRNALAIGPGLSRAPETVDFVRTFTSVFLSELDEEGPRVVLDADALNAFTGEAGLLEPLAGHAVLTPHPGEFKRLAGEAADTSERESALAEFVSRTGVTTLLKGHRTLVFSRDEAGGLRRYTNHTGNPGMATAGSGDVLTGLVTALLAQGMPPHEAACLGAWIHGRAGDLAARRVGRAPLLATDILADLALVIRGIEPIEP